MGQQQLLLLVLGIVIVGIAVVAGIQAFSEGKGKAEQDAAISDAMRIVSDLQAWKLKPTAFGGGSATDSANFSALGSMKSLGYDKAGTAADPYKTTSGCYQVTPGTTTSGATLRIYDVNGTTCATNPLATVTVRGANSRNIAWSYAS